MTDAITGNAMIPSNPGIAAQQIQSGAQQVAPLSSGAPPIVQTPAVVPAAPAESYDFWSSVEQRVDPATLSPDGQPLQAQPVVPAQPGPAVPAPTVPQATALTPEQQAAIVEAGAMQAPVAPQQQPVMPTQANVIEQTIAHLASTEYAMPKEVADQLVSNPEEVYPRLAATMHVRLATQIGQAVQNLLPAIIDKVVGSKIEAMRLEGDFFRLYPQLADARFRPVVAQSISMARQAMPNASREQIMSDGAALAAMKLRIQPQATNGAQVPVQPVVPQQVPLAPALIPVQSQVVAPFQPAAGGGGALPNPVMPTIENEFEAMAMDTNW